jgi:hypothetical protein
MHENEDQQKVVDRNEKLTNNPSPFFLLLSRAFSSKNEKKLILLTALNQN